MKVEMTVCDVCKRPPNGDSPDTLYHLGCGHDVCNECLARFDRKRPELRLPGSKVGWDRSGVGECPECWIKANTKIQTSTVTT